MVLESNVVNNDSGDEVLVEGEFNNGVVVSVDELEEEWKESLQVEGLDVYKRQIFSL